MFMLVFGERNGADFSCILLIVFTRTDKGNTAVALTRADYNGKVETPWECKNLINNLLAKDLKTSNAVSLRLCGLQKIHKEGNPVWPIVSFAGSPIHNLAS